MAPAVGPNPISGASQRVIPTEPMVRINLPMVREALLMI